MSASPAAPDTAGWQARLALGFRPSPGRTVLAERSHRGPLAVQRPLYPEGEVCHCYLLHPPGGVVGGDRLEIEVTVAAQAHALITTPGATKFYRSGGAQAVQTQRLRVDDGGALEWFPQENIFFPGTESRLATRIDLSGTARFIGWEIGVLGRPSNGERFDRGRAEMRLELWRDGRPLLIERLTVVGGAPLLEQSAGLRGHPLTATLLATPAGREHLEAARAALPPLGEGLCALTLVDGVLVGRYLGAQAERARRCLIPVWRALRPLMLGREAQPPRIWAT